MPRYLYHRSTGRIYEVVGQDTTANTVTLRNDMATFTDTYDPQRLAQQGYMKVAGDDEDDAREKAEAKIAAEKGDEEAA